MHLQKIVRSFRIQLLHGTPSNIYVNMFMQKQTTLDYPQLKDKKVEIFNYKRKNINRDCHRFDNMNITTGLNL